MGTWSWLTYLGAASTAQWQTFPDDLQQPLVSGFVMVRRRPDITAPCSPRSQQRYCKLSSSWHHVGSAMDVISALRQQVVPLIVQHLGFVMVIHMGGGSVTHIIELWQLHRLRYALLYTYMPADYLPSQSVASRGPVDCGPTLGVLPGGPHIMQGHPTYEGRALIPRQWRRHSLHAHAMR